MDGRLSRDGSKYFTFTKVWTWDKLIRAQLSQPNEDILKRDSSFNTLYYCAQ